MHQGLPLLDRYALAASTRRNMPHMRVFRRLPADRPRRRGDPMKRRDLIALAGMLAIGLPGAAMAQPYRIGLLRGPSSDYLSDRFKSRLAELGYIEGGDYVLTISAHHGRLARLPELAAELVQGRPDVIVAAGPEAVLRAATSATASIPIVFLAIDYDPITLGYIATLPRPGGNLTGVFARQVELTAKRVELLREALPSATNVAVFADDFTPDTSEQMRAAEAAAARIGLILSPAVLRNAPKYDFATAIEAARKRGAQAALALMSPGFFFERARFVAALSVQRMPASFGLREFADLGGLMSYGANIADMYVRAADYVAKILKGAKPADLPVEQPTRFELVINLKTARAIGLSVPQSILTRADELIE
jgi:putative tryptophan/tyrosine transport system substrate-binding protein